MLRELLKSVKKNILLSKYSAQLSSVRSAIELFLWRMDFSYGRGKDNKDFDFANIIRNCRDMITKGESQPSHHCKTHAYNLLATGQQWNSGCSGFLDDYFGTLQYFRLYEKVGIPFGLPAGFSSDVETKGFMIERLFRYYPKYALQWVVRGCENKLIQSLSRDSLKNLTRETANSYFEDTILACEAGLEQQSNKNQQVRVLKSLVPILVRLSVYLSSAQIERVFDLLCVVYEKYPRFYDGNDVQTLYDNLSDDSLRRCQIKALEGPILKSGTRGVDFRLPLRWVEDLEYSAKAGSIALAGLSSNDASVQNFAFSRIRILNLTKKDAHTSGLIDESVKSWRSIPPLSDDKLESLFEFPAEEDEMCSIASAELEVFVNADLKNDKSSVFIDKVTSHLYRLQIGYSRFTEEQHLLFLNKLLEILVENEDCFKKDDSDNFFGGFRSHVVRIFHYLNYYSQVDGLPQKDNEIWSNFKSVIDRYRKYGYPVLTIMSHLSYRGIWNTTTVKNYISKALKTGAASQVEDAGQALSYMAFKQGNKVNQSIIKDLISKVTYVIDDDTHIYLGILRNILRYKGISKEARGLLEDWISNLPELLEYSAASEGIKDDIRFYANQLAGIMTVVWPDWTGLTKWQSYVSGGQIRNDVRNGFKVGNRMMAEQSTTN